MKNSFDLFDATERKIARGLRIWGAYAEDINLVFGLAVNGDEKYWKISNSNCRCVKEFDEQTVYHIAVDAKKWIRFLSNIISFDDLAFGGHIKVRQGSKGYSTKFHRLLRGLNSRKHLLTVISHALEEKNDVYMLKYYNGKNYKLKRYCPHQGYDLIDVEVEVDGCLTCPAHGWKFEIESKTCIRGDKNLSL